MSISQFIRAAANRPGSFQELLEGKKVAKSILTTASDSGGGLIPGGLQRVIADNLPHYSLPVAMLQPIPASSGDKHEFTRLTSLGGPMPPMGEKASTPSRSSKTEKATRELHIRRRKIRTTGFLADSQREDEVDFEVVGMEIENQVRGHVNDLADETLFGALDREGPGVATVAGRRVNLHDPATADSALPASNLFLENALNSTERWGGTADNQVIYCTSDMISRITENEKNTIRMSADTKKTIGEVEVAGGIRLLSYRGRPLIPTPSCGGESAAEMGSISVSPGPGDGNLSDGDYFVAITGIGWGDEYMGESVLSAIASITLSGGTATQSIQINFSSNIDFLRYKVWVGSASGAQNLRVRDIVPAWNYTADDEPTTPVDQIVFRSMAAADRVPEKMREDLPPKSTSGVKSESLIIHCIDQIRGMGAAAHSNRRGTHENNLISVEPLAKTDDFIEHMAKTYWTLVDANHMTSAVVLGLRSR